MVAGKGVEIVIAFFQFSPSLFFFQSENYFRLVSPPYSKG